MKFHDARSHDVQLPFEDYWEEELLKHKHQIIFEDKVINELKRGLELGNRLKLPIRLACNHQTLSYLFTGISSNPIVRPFKQLM